MPKIRVYDRNENSITVIPAPRTSSDVETRGEGPYLPMLTWEDWRLLQELHKARADQSQNIEITFNEPERKPGMPAAMAAPYGVATGTVTGGAGGILQPVTVKIDSAEVRRLVGELADKTIAELQDQIKDWGAKCQVLEQQASDAKRAFSDAVDLKNKYLAENRQLSKSLQHYRNAYFADSAHTGTGTQPGSVTGGAGIHSGGGGQGGAK